MGDYVAFRILIMGGRFFEMALLSLAVMPITLMAAESTTFNTSNRLTTTSTIEWQSVEHVNEVCQQHSEQYRYLNMLMMRRLKPLLRMAY